MRVMVFGGSGRTGQQMLLQALARGHEVTAIVRDPSSIPSKFECLSIVRGDALKPDSFLAALRGKDAVISSLGVSGFLHSLKPITFYEDSMRMIEGAMRQASVSRFVGVGSVGVLEEPSAPLWYRTIVKPMLRHKYADMKRMENFLRGSSLDWTIARASQLVDGPLTEKYRVGENGELPEIGKISFADLADFVVRQLDDPSYVGKAVAVSY